MKLKLRDEEIEMNKVAENNYIDLLDIARQPSDDDNIQFNNGLWQLTWMMNKATLMPL